VYYFERQDFNQSILVSDDSIYFNSPIRKIFPSAPRPSVLEPDSIRILYPNGADSLYLTEQGFIKYYEYELVVTSLLPTVPYWVNVTAFDYGSPQSGLAALETSPTLLPVVTYPLDAPDPPDRLGSAEVLVWPNPYRLDANYRTRGFEGRGSARDSDDERVRLIHFANLPSECTISIYSLDGDLVRKLNHPSDSSPPGCPATEHEACWELITRNFQQVVSGLYYWTVEDTHGNTQIGKLVIIL
jgi:hypothetical protein